MDNDKYLGGGMFYYESRACYGIRKIKNHGPLSKILHLRRLTVLCSMSLWVSLALLYLFQMVSLGVSLYSHCSQMLSRLQSLRTENSSRVIMFRLSPEHSPLPAFCSTTYLLFNCSKSALGNFKGARGDRNRAPSLFPDQLCHWIRWSNGWKSLDVLYSSPPLTLPPNHITRVEKENH